MVPTLCDRSALPPLKRSKNVIYPHGEKIRETWMGWRPNVSSLESAPRLLLCLTGSLLCNHFGSASRAGDSESQSRARCGPFRSARLQIILSCLRAWDERSNERRWREECGVALARSGQVQLESAIGILGRTSPARPAGETDHGEDEWREDTRWRGGSSGRFSGYGTTDMT